jgi:hypothetical protein
MRSKAKQVEGSAADSPIPGARRGRIVAIDERGQVFVSVGPNRKPTLAALAANVEDAAVRTALDSQLDAILLFEESDPARPIVMGFLRSGPLPASPARHPCIEADVDGRRVRVVAKDEIVLECGKSSITMRRNGKVIVRGTHVETSSEGTNRIKGGQVKIN